MKTKYDKRISIHFEKANFPLVSSLGYDHLLKPISLKPHKHADYELTYITSGEVCWILEDGKKMNLSSNQLVIIPPNVVHYGEWDIISPSTLFWITFSPNIIDSKINSTLFKNSLKMLKNFLDTSKNIIYNMDDIFLSHFNLLLDAMLKFKEQNSQKSMITLKMISLLTLIFIELIEKCQNSDITENEMLKTGAIDYMEKFYYRDLSVADIAKYLGLSTSVFNDKFKRETGLTPANYFTRLKCKKAMDLLTNSKKNITEIAFSLNFSTSQYFANVFKKYTGMSPIEYRRNQTKK